MTRSIHDTVQMVPAPSSHLNSKYHHILRWRKDWRVVCTWSEMGFHIKTHEHFVLVTVEHVKWILAPASCVFSLPRRNNSWLLSTSDTSRQNIGRYNSFIKPEIYSKVESKPSSSMSAISYHRKLGNSNTGVNKTVKYALSPTSQHPYSQCWLIFHWAVHSWI
jgi:hypothetical protein